MTQLKEINTKTRVKKKKKQKINHSAEQPKSKALFLCE